MKYGLVMYHCCVFTMFKSIFPFMFVFACPVACVLTHVRERNTFPSISSHITLCHYFVNLF